MIVNNSPNNPFAPSGQDMVPIVRLPDAPTAGTFYYVLNSTPFRETSRYTDTALLFDGTNFLVQELRDGQEFSLNGEPMLYSPSKGNIPVDSFNTPGANETGGGGAAAPSGGTPADVSAGIDTSSDINSLVVSSDAIAGSIGDPSDASTDSTLIGLLKKIDLNTDEIEVKLDGSQVSIGNIDVDLDSVINSLGVGADGEGALTVIGLLKELITTTSDGASLTQAQTTQAVDDGLATVEARLSSIAGSSNAILTQTGFTSGSLSDLEIAIGTATSASGDDDVLGQLKELNASLSSNTGLTQAEFTQAVDDGVINVELALGSAASASGADDVIGQLKELNTNVVAGAGLTQAETQTAVTDGVNGSSSIGNLVTNTAANLVALGSSSSAAGDLDVLGQLRQLNANTASVSTLTQAEVTAAINNAAITSTNDTILDSVGATTTLAVGSDSSGNVLARLRGIQAQIEQMNDNAGTALVANNSTIPVNTFASIATADSDRVEFTVQNKSTTDFLYVSNESGATANVDRSITIPPLGTVVFNGYKATRVKSIGSDSNASGPVPYYTEIVTN